MQRLWNWDGARHEIAPFGQIDAERLERDLRAAIADWRNVLSRVAADPNVATFTNTLLPLEEGRHRLDKMSELLQLFVANGTTPAINKLGACIAPELERIADDMLLDEALFARFEHLVRSETAVGLDEQDRRLLEVVHAQFIQAGARLDRNGKARLKAINVGLAAAIETFQSNLAEDDRTKYVLTVVQAELDGIDPPLVDAAVELAAEREHAAGWAFASQRPIVMALLASTRSRSFRERIWRTWTSHCDDGGPNDNHAAMTAILTLRSEKAHLLGFDNYAAMVMRNRMVTSPSAAEALLKQAWARVLPATEKRINELRALASADELEGELQPWDRYYYEEQLRQRRFGIAESALRPYLSVDAVIGAALEAAARLHGLTFTARWDVPSIDPDVRVFAVERDETLIGMFHFDVVARNGKRGGSWQQQLQPIIEDGSAAVCFIVTSCLPGAGDAPPLMSWQHVVVLFHEVGHALHMVLARGKYPSLGSLAVPWDVIELPALLNERWLEDGDILRRHLRHWRTGEPIAASMVEGALDAARNDRVFSVTLDYLIGAFIDLRLHSTAGGVVPDVPTVEAEVLAELRIPRAIDQTMRPPYFYHAFSKAYGASVYAYLLGDVMAADVAEAFIETADGLFDRATAKRWQDRVLSIGARAPIDRAYREFKGRDANADALFRRFGLVDGVAASARSRV